uniref:CYtochrome P450 family n=1 Tax=Caenorhabditis tropicalis TaxID=1561998 RepID=A0A1I7TAT9_9PELO
MPLPLFGNVLSLSAEKPGYESFRKWTKQYGDVFTFWLGSSPYVIISSYKRMKETFIKDGETYMNKVQLDFQRFIRDGNYGVAETNGLVWTTHRRFALSTLRDFGLGKDLMQEKILIEVEETFQTFDKNVGKDQDINERFNEGVANVINQMLFGYRFEKEKMEELKKLSELMEYQEQFFSSFRTNFQIFVPQLARFLPGKTFEEGISQWKTDFFAFFDKQIGEHRKKIDFDSDESQDYAEAYLKEQKKREAEGDFEMFSDKQLSNMCIDLWFAGLSTTNITISWTISYVLHNPEVQKKIHEELDQMISSDRMVTMSDKNDLPYMNAVINESQRCANILPVNLFHCTSRDTVLNGYSIQKGTGVLAQISTVMLDEEVFPDPYKFNPERFIDENVKLKKVEELVPFSVGKRQCLGEGLARMELFLFISNFFNRYKVSAASTGLPSLDKSKELGVIPRKVKAVLEKRYV